MKIVEGTEGADIKFDIEVREHGTGKIRTFRTMRMLSNIGADAVRGRGTRVWEVCELGKDGKPIMRPALDVNGKPILDAKGQPTEEPVPFALKDCWSDDDRTLEGLIMEEVYTKDDKEEKYVNSLRKAFMPVEVHGEVFVEGNPDHTRKVIHRSAKLPRPSGVLHVPIEYSARAKVASKLPSVGSMVCGAGKYARKHNPWSDFISVPASVSKPYTAFPSAFGSLPKLSFVIPNLDHGSSCAIAQASCRT